MASLYLTIKLNGLGWTPFGSKGKGDQEEEGYKKLAEDGFAKPLFCRPGTKQEDCQRPDKGL